MFRTGKPRTANETEHKLRTIRAQRHHRNAGGGPVKALLDHCALKAKAEVIYTWNSKDFLRLSPAVTDRVKRPDFQ